jgi:hypothetical protein
MAVMGQGKTQKQATVHRFPEEGIDNVLPEATDVVPYQFAFAMVAPGQRWFRVEAVGPGLRVGPISMAIETITS